MAAVAARYPKFKELGAEVLSISIDTPFVHQVWNEVELSKMVEGGIPFPMLSDPGGRIGTLYGVYDEEEGLDIRGCFIIDPDGVVQAIEILPPPAGRNPDEWIRQIQALQHVRATGGEEAAPACWRPGQTTLKPGPDLVGKVWEVWKEETTEASHPTSD
jgi:peroxiredoxin (alkyl hydroperoxide reductase subunit C)